MAFPLSCMTIHSSVYRLPCEQYKGANPLRATSLQHPSALRASEWLDSLACQALRHFHHTPATTLHLSYVSLTWKLYCSGRVLPLLNRILSHQIQHAPVSVHLRVTRIVLPKTLFNVSYLLRVTLSCSLTFCITLYTLNRIGK